MPQTHVFAREVVAGCSCQLRSQKRLPQAQLLSMSSLTSSTLDLEVKIAGGAFVDAVGLFEAAIGIAELVLEIKRNLNGLLNATGGADAGANTLLRSRCVESDQASR
eukprot:3001815-Pleurochrysis_carterae.AAC.1